MKLIFNEACIDKNTGKFYKVGDVVEFDEKRGAEIIRSSYASKVDDEKPTPKKTAKRAKKEE